MESFHVVLQTIMIVERKQVWAKERQGGCLKNFDEKFAQENGFWSIDFKKRVFLCQYSLEMHRIGLDFTNKKLCVCVSESMECSIEITLLRLYMLLF